MNIHAPNSEKITARLFSSGNTQSFRITIERNAVDANLPGANSTKRRRNSCRTFVLPFTRFLFLIYLSVS